MNILNSLGIAEQYPTQEDCIAHLEAVRWGSEPRCPYCGENKATPMSGEDRHHCNNCNTSFSVTVGTIFHNTHIPLQKWFQAIALILNSEDALSTRELARRLGVNKNTAWRMGAQIRKAMTAAAQHDPLVGIVDADEDDVGNRSCRTDMGGNMRCGGTAKKSSVLEIFEGAYEDRPKANADIC